MTFFVILTVHSILPDVAVDSTISGLFHPTDNNKLFAHIRNV